MHDLIKLENGFEIEQKKICGKYKADYLSSSFGQLIGVAVETFNSFNMPINGLRHPIQALHSANWYIWAGENFSSAEGIAVFRRKISMPWPSCTFTF